MEADVQSTKLATHIKIRNRENQEVELSGRRSAEGQGRQTPGSATLQAASGAGSSPMQHAPAIIAPNAVPLEEGSPSKRKTIIMKDASMVQGATNRTSND